MANSWERDFCIFAGRVRLFRFSEDFETDISPRAAMAPASSTSLRARFFGRGAEVCVEVGAGALELEP